MAGIGLPGRSSSFFFFWLRRVFILTGFLAVVTVSSESQVSFRKPDFDTGKGPVAIAAADFNRDGLPDVVTANSLDNSITVLLNNGNGAFGRRVDYPTGKNPQVVVTGDFNNDGIADVAVANYDGSSVSIFLGTGNGTLLPSAALAVGTRPDAMVIGDFNRDGKTDLAVVSQGEGTLRIYPGNGDGTFRNGAQYILENCSSIQFSSPTDSIAAADFNKDGLQDLVVSGCLGTIRLFTGKGDGSFNSAGGLPGAVGPVAAADFNQDGNIDIAAYSPCQSRGCSILRLIFGGHGDGTFDQGHVVNFADGMPMVTGDFNGNHAPDIATAEELVLIEPPTVFTSESRGTLLPSAGLGVAALAIGDFDGDGKADFVTANFLDNTISLVLGNGDGTFHQRLRYAPVFDFMDAIASADLNGDGVPDLVVGDLGGEFQTYLGRGDGTFQPLATISDKPMEPLLILIGDLNRDGVPDLVLAGIKDPGTGETTAIRVRLGKGDGTFGLPLDVNEDFGNFLIERMLLADFNGDGIPDLAVEAPDPLQPGNTRLSIFFGKGDGTFQLPVYTALSHTALGMAAGDFNGDGIIDLVADTDGLATTGNVSILLGNGNGTFRNSTSYTAGSGVGSFAVADFNRDGIPDFVAIHDGTVTLFLGNGDGTFRQQADTVATTGNPLIADLNGDGFPDLIMSGPSVSVAMNNGNGTFQPQLFFPVGGAAALAVADFDSDGHPDIAVTNNGRALSLLLSRGAGSADGRDFQLNLSAASITVRAGQSATSTVFVTAMGSFKDSVTFSCAGLPAGATCSFSPATMTPPAHGTRNVTLTIAVSNAQTARLSPGTQGSIMFALGLPIFGIVIIRLRRRGRWKGSAGVVLLIAAMVTLGGCAGIGSVDNHRNTVGTPAGVFTITVIGTSGGSVVITRMQTMVLKVQ